MKIAIIATLIVVSFLGGHYLGKTKKTKTKLYRNPNKLKLITKEEGPYYIPPNTPLYYVNSPKSESFDTYIIYINVEGGKMQEQEVAKKNYIEPITATSLWDFDQE